MLILTRYDIDGTDRPEKFSTYLDTLNLFVCFFAPHSPNNWLFQALGPHTFNNKYITVSLGFYNILQKYILIRVFV